MHGRCLFLCAGFLVAILALSGRATAQTVSLRSATTQEFVLAPGSVATGRVEMFNSSPRDQRVNIYQTDYQFRSGGALDFPTSGTINGSAGKWIGLNASMLSVPAGRAVPLDYTIRVPSDSVQPGATYWSVIMVETIPETSVQSSSQANTNVTVQVQETYRSATLVAVTVAGGKTLDEITLANWRVRSDSADGKRQVLVDVANTGRVASRPRVSCEVFDKQGVSRGTFRAEDSERLLLPGSSYTREIDVSGLGAGRYTAIIIADTGTEDLFGVQADIEISPRP